jgi:hypothetical protein
MTNKLKAVVVGAYPRYIRKIEKRLSPFLDFELVMTEDSVDQKRIPGKDVVVILTDYVGRANATVARETARANKVPVIDCVSENYVRARLIEMRLLIEENEAKEPAKVKEAEKTPTAPKQDTSIGLTHEQVLQYVPDAKKAIETIFEPGERHDHSVFMPLLIETIGLPEDVVNDLIIPELVVSGVISNTVGTTWKRMTGGEEAYAFGEDTIEAPKAREATAKSAYIKNVQGMHPGPYRSRYSIAQEMMKYREFLKQDGKAASFVYLQKIAKWAQDEGAVEEKDDQYFVRQDTSITLTLIKPPEPVKAPIVPKTEVKIGKTPIPTKFVSLASLTAVIPSVKETPNVAPKSVRSIGLIDVHDVPLQLRTLKNMMPELFWDDMAFRSIAARLIAARLPANPLSKDSFEREEWDALAWETIKKLPLANVVPVWMPDNFKDERLICADCSENFVFTKDDQEYFYRKFGDVKRPKACLPCRKVRRSGHGTTDDSGERILNRYGG